MTVCLGYCTSEVRLGDVKLSKEVMRAVYYYWDVFKWQTQPAFWQRSYRRSTMTQMYVQTSRQRHTSHLKCTFSPAKTHTKINTHTLLSTIVRPAASLFAFPSPCVWEPTGLTPNLPVTLCPKIKQIRCAGRSITLLQQSRMSAFLSRDLGSCSLHKENLNRPVKSSASNCENK